MDIETKFIKENHRPFRNVNTSEIEYNQIKYSIRDKGVLTPIHVREIEDDFYEVIKGHHRLKAVRELGIGRIPCVVHYVDHEEASKLYLTLSLTTIQLKPKDIIHRLQRLLGSGDTINFADVATDLGMSEERLKKYIKISDIEDAEILNLIDIGSVTLSNAYTLARLPKGMREDHMSEAMHFNARDFKTLVDDALRVKRCDKKMLSYDDYLKHYEGHITRKSSSFLRKELNTFNILSQYGHMAMKGQTFKDGYELGLRVSLGIDPLSVDLLLISKARRKRDLL